MLREVQVDVARGRVQLLYPTAPFVPLFRKIPLLATAKWAASRRCGRRNWRVSSPCRSCPPCPLRQTSPWHRPSCRRGLGRPRRTPRISPALSVILKERRRAASVEGGRFVTVPHPGVPAVEVDRRKWPEVTLQALTLEDGLALPADTLACLDTPLAVQDQARLEGLVGKVYAVLQPNGYWHFVDLMPSSMPAHWVFTCFPEAWTYVRGATWTPRKIYNSLRGAGFGVVLRYLLPADQPGAADIIAQQRAGILATLPAEAYRKGLARLATAMRAQGAAGHHRLGGDFGRGGSSQG